MWLFRSFSLSRALCRVAGHDPARAARLGCLQWYATLGVFLLVLPSLSGVSTYRLMRSELAQSTPASVVGGVCIALIVFGIDRLITMSPLLEDGARHRARFLLVRGSAGLLLSTYTAFGIIVPAYSDGLKAIAHRQAIEQAGADTRSTLDAYAAPRAEISAAQARVTQLTDENAGMVAQAAALQKTYLDDTVPCAPGSRRACNGDWIGEGNTSLALKKAWQDYVTTVQLPKTDQNDKEIARLSAQIAADQKTVQDGTAATRGVDLADTGLAAQTQALWPLMKQDAFLWLLPLVLITLDMGVAISKAVHPATAMDLEQRAARADHTRTERAKATDPAWQAAYAEANRIEAAAWLGRRTAAVAADPVPEGAPAAPMPRGAARRPLRVAGAGLLAVLLVAGGVGVGARLDHPVPASASSTPGRGGAASTAAGTAAGERPLTVPVSPEQPVSVSVPSVGTLSADRGAFSGAGTMTITPVTATPPATAGVVATGKGVDVTFSGTHLLSPVTLAFAAPPSGSPSALPVVAHRSDSGQWDYVPAVVDAEGRIAAVTENFSVNVPGWITDLGRWAGDVGQWVGNRLASALAGRTSPLSCSGAPGWFRPAVGHSDLVHVCAKDAGPDAHGQDRAEIQIKSNRGVTLEVTVPGDPQYVWVQDQSWNERAWLLPKLGKDPNRTVLLPAGETMTVGYTQPAAHQDLSFWVDGATPLAVSDTLLRQAMAMFSGEWPQSWFVYTEGACATGFQAGLSGLSTSTSFTGLLNCLKDQVLSQFEDPASADRIVAKIGASKADSELLVAAAKRIPDVAVLAALVPVFQEGWGNDIDVLKNLATGGRANQVDVAMDGRGTTPAPTPRASTPPVAAPPAVAPPVAAPPASAPPVAAPPVAAPPAVAPPASAPPVAAPPVAAPPASTPPAAAPSVVAVYDDYGPATGAGLQVCRGNPGRPESMPGGTVSQTFTVPVDASITAATVQIDPDSTVTAHAALLIGGVAVARADSAANGDTAFSFGRVAVAAGTAVTLQITFSATSGKITTVYRAGSPGGSLTVSNSCSDGAPSETSTASGLRAVVHAVTQ